MVAREYHAAGYRVVIDPPADMFPPDIGALKPEIVALRDGESVVIELIPKEQDADRSRVGALAAALQWRPGWRLDMVLGEEGYMRAPHPPAWTRDDFSYRLDKGRKLIASDQGEAAILLLFAVAEAVGRALLEAAHVKAQQWDPKALFATLVQQGLVDDQDKIRLENARLSRNSIMHGESVGYDTESEARQMVEIIERMLAELSSEEDRSAEGAATAV